MNCPSIGKTDQEVEVIFLKFKGKSVSESRLKRFETKIKHFLQPCALCIWTYAWIKSGHVIFHAPHFPVIQARRVGQWLLHEAFLWGTSPGRLSGVNNKSFHITLCMLFSAVHFACYSISWYPAHIKSTSTISCPSTYHKQQYLISCSSNQVHLSVTYLKQPLHLGTYKNKKIQVRMLAEKLMPSIQHCTAQ